MIQMPHLAPVSIGRGVLVKDKDGMLPDDRAFERSLRPG